MLAYLLQYDSATWRHDVSRVTTIDRAGPNHKLHVTFTQRTWNQLSLEDDMWLAGSLESSGELAMNDLQLRLPVWGGEASV